MQGMTNYSYGVDAFVDLPQVLHRYQFQKVVLIGGERALAAVEKEVKELLLIGGFTYLGSLVYGKLATQSAIDTLVGYELVQEADVIIGVGGGQALDVTKMVAKECRKNLLTIPTICSTCAAGTGLAVIYNDDHSFAYYGSAQPPLHTFINTRVFVQAPSAYFWAGIGDGLSKGPEVTCAVTNAVDRGFVAPHAAKLGLAIAQSSFDALYQYGFQALQDVANHQVSFAVEEVALAIIVSMAYASNLVVQPEFDLTTCHAHAFYNGTTVVKESRKHLHGAVVAFGIMVMHAYFEEREQLEKIARLNHSLQLPLTLADMSLTVADIPAIVAAAVNTDEYRNTPFEPARFAQAIEEADQFGRNWNCGDETLLK